MTEIHICFRSNACHRVRSFVLNARLFYTSNTHTHISLWILDEICSMKLKANKWWLYARGISKNTIFLILHSLTFPFLAKTVIVTTIKHRNIFTIRVNLLARTTALSNIGTLLGRAEATFAAEIRLVKQGSWSVNVWQGHRAHPRHNWKDKAGLG